MFSLGVDYGTNSVRALVVRCADGAELGSAVFDYPSGTAGVLLSPQDHQLARQHPGETMAEWFVEGLLERLLDNADPVARKVRACPTGSARPLKSRKLSSML